MFLLTHNLPHTQHSNMKEDQLVFTCPDREYLSSINGKTGAFVDAVGGTCSGGQQGPQVGQSDGQSFTRVCPMGFSGQIAVHDFGRFVGTRLHCSQSVDDLRPTGRVFGEEDIQQCPMGQVAVGYNGRMDQYEPSRISEFSLKCGPAPQMKGSDVRSIDFSHPFEVDIIEDAPYLRTTQTRETISSQKAHEMRNENTEIEDDRIVAERLQGTGGKLLASVLQRNEDLADSVGVSFYVPPVVIGFGLLWYMNNRN